MAQVFLSYDRDDVDRARPIALALEAAGHAVWWDPHIRGGEQYSKVIDEALSQSDAVVVLWSRQSVDSAWVRDEAAAGRDSGKLVPVTLDGMKPPIGFRQYQTIDMSRRMGRGRPQRLADLLASVDALGGGPAGDVSKPVEGKPRQPAFARQSLLIAIVVLALVGSVAALMLWSPWTRNSTAPVVAVRPANASPSAKELARDLLVRLGDIQPAAGDPLPLIDESSRTKPDLIFEVSAAASALRPSASLVLLRGNDRQLLSSQDVEAATPNLADLKQSLAVSAARLLGCATEALGAPGRPLRLPDLKLYLGACDRFATIYGSPDPVPALLPLLEKVVQNAPGFEPAWKRLLLVEASLQTLANDRDKPSPDRLKDHLTQARRIDAAMPEANVAESALLPMRDFPARQGLIDRAAEAAPDNPFVLDARSAELMRIGRLNDALSYAEQAAALDPLSPSTRNAYILALAYSGRLPRALHELDEAQRRSPAAHNLIETRFHLNMRYGDPRVALQILRSHGTGAGPEAFLLARIEPTPGNIERAIAVARAMAARFGTLVGGQVETLAAFGRNDEIYELLMQLPEQRFDGPLAATLFRPTLKNFRQQPRFLIVAQRFGLLDYWRSSGRWPDFCSDPDLPYDCKKEAAKVTS